MTKVNYLTDGVFRFLTPVMQFIMRLGIACGVFVAIQIVMLNIMPMEFWVNFKKVEVVETDGNSPEIVEVNRDIFPLWNEVRIERHTELRSDGMRYCTEFLQTTAERAHEVLTPVDRSRGEVAQPSEAGKARFILQDFLGEDCNLTAHEGRNMDLQVVYVIETLYGITKTRRFNTGPFRVTAGNFVFDRLSLSFKAPFGRRMEQPYGPPSFVEATVGGR